jgi:hypothetical protein
VVFDLSAVRPSVTRAFDLSPAGLRSPFPPIDPVRDGIEAARLGLETADLLPRWPVRETIGSRTSVRRRARLLAYRRSERHHRSETDELRPSPSRPRVVSAAPFGSFDLLFQSPERVRAVGGRSCASSGRPTELRTARVWYTDAPSIPRADRTCRPPTRRRRSAIRGFSLRSEHFCFRVVSFERRRWDVDIDRRGSLFETLRTLRTAQQPPLSSGSIAPSSVIHYISIYRIGRRAERDRW